MIFYFSGTGNSAYAARRMANETGDRTIRIAESLREDRVRYTLAAGEKIGFVFPVYYWGVPTIVLDFIKRLSIEGAARAYVYAVCTCGAETGAAPRMLKTALTPQGLSLAAAYGLPMVDNYIPMYDIVAPEKLTDSLRRADEELSLIIAGILRGEHNPKPTHEGSLPSLKTAAFYPFYKHGRSTRKFRATAACTGCGHCVSACPLGIISLVGKSPTWKPLGCAQCLACIHRCPQRAIQYGKRTESRGRYRNPNVPECEI